MFKSCRSSFPCSISRALTVNLPVQLANEFINASLILMYIISASDSEKRESLSKNLIAIICV